MIQTATGLISWNFIWLVEASCKICEILYTHILSFSIFSNLSPSFTKIGRGQKWTENRIIKLIQIQQKIKLLFVNNQQLFTALLYSNRQQMKSSINRFDYPTACSHTYKIFKETKSKQVDPQAQKQKYRQFDKQQRDMERFKAQKQKEKKLEIQRRQNKRKIEEQLEKKKQQLIELQKMKNMAIEAEKKSQQLAIIRQEQQRIMKIEQQRKAKQNQFNAQNRFIEALRRLQQQKDINSQKQKQAQFRRKVIQQTQKMERGRAIKYREQVEQKQRAIQPEQKITFKDYKQPLGRNAYNRTVDYTRTYFHNPSIIISQANANEQQNAIVKAQQFIRRQEANSSQKKARQQQNKRISIERGRKAMEKIAQQKQYQQYLREQEEKAKQYNIERIQAGKKNQYVGLKPATMVQMEANKRIRGQQEFEQMFFGGQNPQWFDKPTNRYNIWQNKMGETLKNAGSQAKQSYPSRSLGSVGAAVSSSHYSFQSEPIQELTSVKKIQQQHESQAQKKRVIPLPKQLNQQNLGASNQKDRQQLSYSQSQNQQP